MLGGGSAALVVEMWGKTPEKGKQMLRKRHDDKPVGAGLSSFSVVGNERLNRFEADGNAAAAGKP